MDIFRWAVALEFAQFGMDPTEIKIILDLNWRRIAPALVKLSGGRIVEVEVKAILDTMDGMRLQVSFREETVDAFQRFSRTRLSRRSGPK